MKAKRVGSVAQKVELLLSKHKALSSKFNDAKNKQTKKSIGVLTPLHIFTIL
jgi:hypothetical protein